MPIESTSIYFSEDSLLALNIALGFIMFGIALGIKPADFSMLVKKPLSPFLGLLSQFAFLPILTVLLLAIIKPHASLALGMILVACCPGGNVSNFIASISGANVALSVCLTAIATLLTPVLTPLNFELCASILPETKSLLHAFNLSFVDILTTVILVLVMPLTIGLIINNKAPKISKRIQKPVKLISVIILIAFIVGALINNLGAFSRHFGIIFLLVFVHNALAFSIGYATGVLGKISQADRRTLCIETGIQNSGLGLIVIFTFFDGNAGMALIAAWWGIWHILAGLILSGIFSYQSKLSLVIKR